MTTDGKHEETSLGEDEDAALWALLERAPRPKPVSPYFARRVLREVAALAADRSTAEPVSGWLTRVWRSWHGQSRGVFAGALGAVALLAAGAGFSPLRWHAPASSNTARVAPAAPAAVEESEGDGPDEEIGSSSLSVVSVESMVTSQDVEVIADLDNLLSREESRLWTEDDTARF